MKTILPACFSLAGILLFAAGCTTEHYITDARHPEVVVKEDGGVTYRGRYVDPEDLPDLLEDSGLTKNDTINILIPANLPDYRVPRKVMGILAQNGFRRPILVSERQSYSTLGQTAEERRRAERKKRQEEAQAPSSAAPQKRKIRYK